MKTILRLAMALLWSCSGLVSPLSADILYWDADGSGATGNPPTSGVGGSGTWNTTSANWWNGSTYQTWASGDTADFRGDSGTITLGETVSVGAIIANSSMSFVDSGAHTLDFSGAAGSFQREVSGNNTLSTQIKAVDGFTFSSSLNNSYSINMGSEGANEFSGTLNVNTYIKMFRNNMLGGAVGTAAHLNMNDKGLIEYRQSGIHGTFASIAGTSGSRIFLDQPSFYGSLTLTGAGLTSSDVRTFSGTLDHVNAASMSVIKQGSYTQAFDGGDKLTSGINIQDGGMRFAGGFIEAPNLTLSGTATAQMYGGTTRVDTLIFSASGGMMDFNGGTLALQGNWDLDSLTSIENSTFTVQGEDSEVARSLLQFTAGDGEFSGYTMIIPEPGSLALIAFGVGGLLFLRRRGRLALALLWSAAVLVMPLSAATLYWDADGTGATGNPPTSGVGGGGTWDTTTANWWNGSTYQTWAAGATADFRGDSGTITLGENVSVRTIVANSIVSFPENGANTLDFSGAAGTFNRNLHQNIILSTRIKATDGFTFSSSFNNTRSINMGTGNVNEFSGALNVFTRISIFRNNALGGAVGTAAHLNMNDNGIVEHTNAGVHGTYASITGTSGSRIFLNNASFNGSLTLTGAGLSSSDVRTFNGALDSAHATRMSVIKQGSYIQAFHGGDTLTTGIDIQNGGIRFAGGNVDAPLLTLSGTAMAQMYGGITRVDSLTFSSSGGIMDFNGGTLALQGNWDLSSFASIANSTFTVQGEDTEEARSTLLFTSGTGDYSGYTMINAYIIPEPGSLALIALGAAGLLFLRRHFHVA